MQLSPCIKCLLLFFLAPLNFQCLRLKVRYLDGKLLTGPDRQPSARETSYQDPHQCRLCIQELRPPLSVALFVKSPALACLHFSVVRFQTRSSLFPHTWLPAVAHTSTTLFQLLYQLQHSKKIQVSHGVYNTPHPITHTHIL